MPLASIIKYGVSSNDQAWLLIGYMHAHVWGQQCSRTIGAPILDVILHRTTIKMAKLIVTSRCRLVTDCEGADGMWYQTGSRQPDSTVLLKQYTF